MRRWWMVLFAVVGCRRHEPVTIARDPAPMVDAAAPTPTVSPDLVLLHGKVIDLRARAVRHVLVTTPVREASQGDDGYVLDGGMLRAFSLASGKERWAAAAPGCSVLAATRGAAFCSEAKNVTVYARSDGASHTTTLAADVTTLLPLDNRLLALRADSQIEALHGDSGASLGSIALPFAPYGHRASLVVSAHHTACTVSAPGPEFQLACVDATPALRLHKTYPLRKPTDPPSTWFNVRELGRYYAIVSTWSGATRRGVVVELKTGAEVARLEEEIAATVATEAGSLEGLLCTRPTTRLLTPTGSELWTSPEKLHDSANAFVFEQSAVVTSFHPIATGATLHAFDLATGKTRFTADVELLPIAHSKYFNATSVWLGPGTLVLRGREAGQDYLELFDDHTGKRLFTEMLPRAFW